MILYGKMAILKLNMARFVKIMKKSGVFQSGLGQQSKSK